MYLAYIMIEEVFKHSFIYFELFLSRFLKFFPHYLLTGYDLVNIPRYIKGNRPNHDIILYIVSSSFFYFFTNVDEASLMK